MISEDSPEARSRTGPRINLLHLSPELLERASRWTAGAAMTEFLLLRVLIRFGPMLPPSAAVTQAAEVVLFVGTVAFNVAAILTTLALLIIAARSVTRSMVLRSLLVAVAVLTLIRTAWPQGITPVLDVIFLLYSVFALAAMVTAFVRHSGPRSGKESLPRTAETLHFAQGDKIQVLLSRVTLVLLIVIYGVLAYSTVMATLARLGWQWGASASSAAPHFLAEGLAVLVALMVYFVYRPVWNKGAIAGAWIVTGLLGGFWIVRPWLASALTQWTVDFATFLPPWLYLLGLACYVYTLIALARSGMAAGRLAAWGLTLIALGGLRWDFTYFSGLGLLGFLLLAEQSLAEGGT